MTCGIDFNTFEELSYRENDGMEVSLLWNRESNTLSVFVCDTRGDRSFEIAVAPNEALDAFHHPYAYAAFRGVEYRAPVPAAA